MLMPEMVVVVSVMDMAEISCCASVVVNGLHRKVDNGSPT